MQSSEELHPEVLGKTAISRTTSPSIIYIGDGDTLDLTNIIDHPRNQELTDLGIEIFLFEWLKYYRTEGEKFNRFFYNELEYSSLEHDNLRSELLDKLQNFSINTKIPITVNACEYNISTHFSKFYNSLNLRCLDIQNQIETLGLDLLNKKPSLKKEINYKFWCATNRYTIYRHIIMCFLVDKLGKYSWRFIVPEMFNNIPYLKNLPWEDLKIRNQVLNSADYFIDQKKDKVTVTDLNTYNSIGYLIDANASGGEIFQRSLFDCFVSIVNETTFFQPTAAITEKTLNPMFSMTPFVLVSPPFCLEYLHKLGFKTFGNWWDESYDLETDHEKRILKIFNVIEYINKMSLEQLQSIYKEMIPTLLWNQEHVLKFYKQDKILP